MASKMVRYSEGFKLQVVDELERGRFSSPHEAAHAYGIGCLTTVQRWARQYGRGHLIKKAVRVVKPGEPGEIGRLRDRVRKLEAALADAHMDSALNEAFFEILCERTRTDPVAFKKKHGGKAPTGLAGKPDTDKE
jgi:transposase-like protein